MATIDRLGNHVSKLRCVLKKRVRGCFGAHPPRVSVFRLQLQALGKTRIATTNDVCAFSYGKEADQLNRLNDYGYRYYDPLSLTWTQADPLYRIAPDLAYDQPRKMSLYAFSLNNPMRYVDPDGREPGDPFLSVEAAQADFHETYNDDSIRENREFGTRIYSFRQKDSLNPGKSTSTTRTSDHPVAPRGAAVNRPRGGADGTTAGLERLCFSNLMSVRFRYDFSGDSYFSVLDDVTLESCSPE